MGELSCFEIVVSIIEIVFVIIGGSILGILSYRRSVLDAIWQWTQLDGSQEVMDARRFVQYEMPKNYCVDDLRNNIDNAETKIAPIINAYHHLGMLISRRYIPINIFKDNSTGITIIITYEKLLPYIMEIRKSQNLQYASDFEYLYRKIKRFYK